MIPGMQESVVRAATDLRDGGGESGGVGAEEGPAQREKVQERSAFIAQQAERLSLVLSGQKSATR